VVANRANHGVRCMFIEGEECSSSRTERGDREQARRNGGGGRQLHIQQAPVMRNQRGRVVRRRSEEQRYA